MRWELCQDVPALTDVALHADPAPRGPEPSLAAARRRLALDAVGISLSAIGFGVVYGLAAREAGLSLGEGIAMSVFVFAGASQFAAAGLIAQGAPWPAIVVLTALLNARHALYAAALLPWLRTRPRIERAAMAHVLTDEAFALSLHHFQRLGRVDVPGYWIAAVLVFVPWNVATLVGLLGGAAIPDPARLGIDVVFPAAMAGLAALLVRGRSELAAAIVGAVLAVGVGIAIDPAAGVVVGGLVGPLAGLAVPAAPAVTRDDLERTADALGFAPVPSVDDRRGGHP